MGKFLLSYLIVFFIFFNAIYGCSKIRKSAGVTRQSPNEYQAIENPPLVIPPDLSLVSPNQLQKKDIDNVEKELAEEILFGLNKKEMISESEISTMNQILTKTSALSVSDSIREEIDQEYINAMDTKGIFQIEWETEREVLDAVKESERIREKKFNNESLVEGQVPIKKEKIKKKKKKRFIFF